MEKLFESFNEYKNISEAKEEFTYKGNTFLVDFIKDDGPVWHLMLTDKKTREILVWPEVFHYEEGWTQGYGRSQRQYFLQTKHYGGESQGSGRSSQTTPIFIDDQLEYILKAYYGKHYSKEAVEWYQENVYEFPKGTKKKDIKQSLN